MIRREWDPANDRDPDTIGAGYDKRIPRIAGRRPSLRAACGSPAAPNASGIVERRHGGRRRTVSDCGGSGTAWGDYDEPQTPIVRMATIAALALALANNDEDF